MRNRARGLKATLAALAYLAFASCAGALLGACGSSSHSGDGWFGDSAGFGVTVPPGSAGASLSFTDEDEAHLAYEDADDIRLRSLTISSSHDLSFATTIEVEAKDWSFFQARWRTIGRFRGALPRGTTWVQLELRETHLDGFVAPLDDAIEIKVRVRGAAPAQPVPLWGRLDLRLRYQDEG